MWKKRKIFTLIINVSVVFLFLSQSLCAGSLHFIAYGDTRCEINTVEKPQVKHNAIAKVIREMSPDFILFTGDMVYYTELKKRSRHVLIKEFKEKLPPAYSAYMEDVLKNSTEGQSWYSFIKEINGLKIKYIALNSSLPGDDEQFRWFIDELRQFNGPKIVFEHYPPYSTGFHGCNDILLIICGHEHNYQRIYRIGKAGRMQLPVYIISGGGGAEIAGPCDCDVTQIPFHDFVSSGTT